MAKGDIKEDIHLVDEEIVLTVEDMAADLGERVNKLKKMIRKSKWIIFGAGVLVGAGALYTFAAISERREVDNENVDELDFVDIEN